MSNKSNKDNKWKLWAPLGGVLLLLTTFLWILSNIAKWGWNWGFSEPSFAAFMLMGMALLLFPYLSEFSLPGGIVFKLKDTLEEIQEFQLNGEVVFTEDERSNRHLFWIDAGRKRPIQDSDTASLLMAQKGFISISKDQLSKIEDGAVMPSISKESFRRTKQNNMFAILDGKIFHLSSLSLVMKHGWLNKLDEIPFITPEDFQKNSIFR